MRNRNWFWGLFFIVGGIILFAQQMGWTFGLNLWQIFVIVFMSSIILKSLPRLEYFGIIMPLAFVFITTRNFFPEPYKSINPFTLLLTGLFLSIGLSILFKKKIHYTIDFDNGRSFTNRNDSSDRENLSGEDVYASVTFGDSVKYIYSDNLRSARFNCSFGVIKVYFEETNINEEGRADIYVDCKFGSAELYIPKDWNVINDVSYTFASVDDYTRLKQEDGPQVYIRGNATFGEVKIFRI